MRWRRTKFLAGHHRPASETPFQRRFAAEPMMTPGNGGIFHGVGGPDPLLNSERHQHSIDRILTFTRKYNDKMVHLCVALLILIKTQSLKQHH